MFWLIFRKNAVSMNNLKVAPKSKIMLNTLSPTAKNRPFFNYQRGDIVEAFGEIAVILDVLRSDYTDNICIYVRFVRNIGNSRPYDMLEVSPQLTKGVDKWQPATLDALKTRIADREKYLQKEVAELLDLVNSPQLLAINGQSQ